MPDTSPTESTVDPQPSLIPAAQYVRMSTEHQQYSTENQADVIKEYAVKRGYQIIRTYADDGKSGLNIAGRDSLQRLIADVQEGRADFKTILVYDISRWGRFQDSDESAYYEYMCKRAGINVQYCAEQFENDGTPAATIIKSVKRAMAGEYSRELSTKVFKGQCRLIEMGYRQGGPAGYGLRRMLLDDRGQPKGLLKRGEKKSLQMDRVILVPGPEDELQVVRRIYELFTQQAMKEGQIAAALIAEGVPWVDPERVWSASIVHQILTNEKYIGNNVYNRVSFKLKKKRIRNGPEKWVRRDGAFPPIVDPAQFFMARGIILERSRRFTDEELIAKLKALFQSKGALSAEIIDESEGMPASGCYKGRFGSLLKAYRLVGFVPERDYRFLDILRHLRSIRPPFVEDVVRQLQQMGATITHDPKTGQMRINDEYTADIVLTRCQATPGGSARWLIEFKSGADITVVVRMDPANQVPTDYYLLPRTDITKSLLRLRDHNGAAIDTYRRDSLALFMNLAARAPIEVAA